MTRKNIFEILEEKYDIEEEIRKISNLFNNMKFMKTNPLNFQSELYLSLIHISEPTSP